MSDIQNSLQLEAPGEIHASPVVSLLIWLWPMLSSRWGGDHVYI